MYVAAAYDRRRIFGGFWGCVVINEGVIRVNDLMVTRVKFRDVHRPTLQENLWRRGGSTGKV